MTHRETHREHGHARSSTAYRRLLAALLCAGIATFAQPCSPQGVLRQTDADLGTSADRAAVIPASRRSGVR